MAKRLYEMNSVAEIKTSSAVQLHINMLQTIIGKMGDNSKHCKQWCIATQSLFFGFVKDDFNWWFFCCAVIVSFLFMFQDAAYLAFSRHFREQQKQFVEKINSSDKYDKDIYLVKTLHGCQRYCAIFTAMMSFYVLPYYVSFIFFFLFYLLSK